MDLVTLACKDELLHTATLSLIEPEDLGIVQSLYNTPQYTARIWIEHSHVVAHNFFYHAILQRNDRK